MHFALNFPTRYVRMEITIFKFVTKVRTHGILTDRKQSKRNRVLTVEKPDDSGRRLENSPRQSLRRLSLQNGVSIDSGGQGEQRLNCCIFVRTKLLLYLKLNMCFKKKEWGFVNWLWSCFPKRNSLEPFRCNVAWPRSISVCDSEWQYPCLESNPGHFAHSQSLHWALTVLHIESSKYTVEFGKGADAMRWRKRRSSPPFRRQVLLPSSGSN